MKPTLGALLGLALTLVLAPDGASGQPPAVDDAFKLVLTPLPGHPLPARVCLASRSARLTRDAGTVSGLSRLADAVRCADGRCIARAAARPAGCGNCPEAPSDACAPGVDPGGWSIDDYTLVCGDDDTATADAGTVYIAIESVEAENPPDFYTVEVSGGRVRWSPISPIRNPSYRVIGGDFEASRISYPRAASTRRWAEVPIRHRCRCLDVQLPVDGAGPVRAATVDGEPVCHGVSADGQRVTVDVPAAQRGAARRLAIETRRGRFEAGWSGRWPVAPIATRARAFSFDWRRPCAWPGADCPTVALSGARCTASAAEGYCRYACEVADTDGQRLPAEARFDSLEPPTHWRDFVTALDIPLTGQPPADQRLVRLDRSGWAATSAGNRVEAIEVVDSYGRTGLYAVPDDRAGPMFVPAPGARCGASIRIRNIGQRTHAPRLLPIGEGGRVALAPPGETAVPWDLRLGLAGGIGLLGFDDAEDVPVTARSGHLRLSAGVHRRLARLPVSIGGRLSAAVLRWPWEPFDPIEPAGIADPGDVWSTVTLLDVVASVNLDGLGLTLALYGGVGGGVLLALDSADTGKMPGPNLIVRPFVGLRLPLGLGENDRIDIAFEYGRMFQGVMRQFTRQIQYTGYDIVPVGVDLLTGGIGVRF